MIKRGLRNNARKHARNIIPKQAQSRLTETVEAFNNQVQNSLAVDAVGVVLYQINRMVGRPCSCCKTNTPFTPGSNVAPVIPAKDSYTEDVQIDFQGDDIFGSGFDEKILDDVHDNDVHMDVSGGAVGVLEEEQFEDGLAPGSINCGICYRTLNQPGFTMYGQQRKLFTHYDMQDVVGYNVDSTCAPHAFRKEDIDGYVLFRLQVPKYFISATYSIRDNTQVLKKKLRRVDGEILTIADLKRHAGTTIDFKIDVTHFTHVAIEFDLGVPRLNCNIGGENSVLDYNRLMTMSDIPIVFGPEVSEVNEGDIVAIPERGLYMKIHDKERKITADQRRLEWVCNARVLQPTEPLRHIAKGYKLL